MYSAFWLHCCLGSGEGLEYSRTPYWHHTTMPANLRGKSFQVVPNPRNRSAVLSYLLSFGCLLLTSHSTIQAGAERTSLQAILELPVWDYYSTISPESV